MSLGNGRHYLAIPGPSVMPDRVLQAMHRPAPNIYHGELEDMMPVLLDGLRGVARSTGPVAVYIANGHGVWEAAVSNVLSRGDRVLVLTTGRFGEGWGDLAARMGADVEFMDFGNSAPVDAARVAERLSAPDGADFRAVMMVQVDTSTSVKSDVAAVRKAMDDAGHDGLLMVDCIACLACDDFHMDAWGVDVMVAGSQKGLMTPPGMGFVFFSDKAADARERADCVTPYWDWKPRVAPELYYQYFFGTAPTHHLFGLREALSMIADEGLDAVLRRHAVLAHAIWAAVDHWGQGGDVALNVGASEHRSHAVTSVYAGSDRGKALQDWCEERAGLTLGIGLGMEPMTHYFRIGHMGHVNAQMVLGALGTLEAGMSAVGIKHQTGGVVAAADVIAAKA